MKIWLFKKLLTVLLSILDSWPTGKLTAERALSWRRVFESVTIGRALKRKKNSNNAFVGFMTILLKSSKLNGFKNK